MESSMAIDLVKDFNYFADTRTEERINSGEGARDTVFDTQRFVKEIEPQWEDTHREILEEAEGLPDGDFFEVAEYAMLNSSIAIPSFVERGLKARGEAGEAFIRERLDSDVLLMDVNSSALTREELYDTDMVISAISLAGAMKSDSMYDALCGAFRKCISANELFLEKIIAAMSDAAAEKHILALLCEDLPDSKKADAMQMAVNCGIRNDEFYNAMKKSFRQLSKTPNTDIVGAMLMFDYGDARIIPAMRKLAITKIEALDPEQKTDNTSIYILLSMINRMGGNTLDLTGGKDIFGGK